MVIIGIDPHPGSHTAAVLDKNGKVLNHLSIVNDKAGIKSLKKWLKSYEVEACAVEGANNPFARELTCELMKQYKLVNINANLTSQYRRKRTSTKNDEVDAENIARAYLANPDLSTFCVNDNIEQLKALTRTRENLVAQLTAHGLSLRTAEQASVKAALESVISVLKAEIKKLEQAMKKLVKALMPELLELQGVGLVHAATLLAEVGDVRTLKSQHAFAMSAGCAPVQRSSGGQKRYQLNTRGNRKLNKVFHMIVQVRLRLDEATKTYVAKKEQEGKTKRAAFRCLKTYIARQVFKFMLDNTRSHPERWLGT